MDMLCYGIIFHTPGVCMRHSGVAQYTHPYETQVTYDPYAGIMTYPQKRNTKVDTKIKAMTQSTSDASAFEFSDVLGIPGFSSSGESPLCSLTPVSMGSSL